MSALCTFALIASSLLAYAQQPGGGKAGGDKELLAVLDFQIVGGTQAEAAALTNQLRAEMLKTGKVILVDRSQMKAILSEQALEQTGCTSQECAVQVGRILGIRQIVAGTLTKISDNLWQVSALLLDVETAQTLKAETLNHKGDFSSLLFQGMAKLAEELTGAPPSQSATQQRAAILTLLGQQTGDKISLNGKLVTANRSGRYALAPGHYTLRVEREGFRPHQEVLPLASGQSIPIQLDSVLEPISGTLTVHNAPEGSTVKLTGGIYKPTQLQRALPVHKLALPVGAYDLTVVLPDNSTQHFTVNVHKDTETDVSVAAATVAAKHHTRKVWAWVLVGFGSAFAINAEAAARAARHVTTDYHYQDYLAAVQQDQDSATYAFDLANLQYYRNHMRKESVNADRSAYVATALFAWAGYLFFETPSPDYTPVALSPAPQPDGTGLGFSLAYRF